MASSFGIAYQPFDRSELIRRCRNSSSVSPSRRAESRAAVTSAGEACRARSHADSVEEAALDSATKHRVADATGIGFADE
jgi:hypothetical protein